MLRFQTSYYGLDHTFSAHLKTYEHPTATDSYGLKVASTVISTCMRPHFKFAQFMALGPKMALPQGSPGAWQVSNRNL